MRLLIIFLATLLVLIQYPLWLGKGGWLRVWDLDKQVQAAQKKNDELKARNAKLNSEVEDLREGTGAVEERARYELGMIKENEVFVQILDTKVGKPAAGAAAAPKPDEAKPAQAAKQDVPAPAAGKTAAH